MTMAAEPFEELSPKDIAESPLFKTEQQLPDPVWAERIGKLAVGAGFRMHRPEGETVRQLKKRINRAAGVTFRTLDWRPEQKNLPEGQEPSSFVVKVRSLDLKAKAEAEEKAKAATAQNGSGSPQEAQQTTPENPGTPTPPEEATGPRAARRA